MDSALASKCAGCPYRGRHIYVVGALRFERELIVDFISTHTAAKWFQAESLKAVPVSNQGIPHGRKMLLIDTHLQDRDSLVRQFSSKAWEIHAHNLLAMFNVQHEYEIEKEALKSGVRGFLYSDDPAENLINGICAINSGEYWFPRRILSECLQESYVGKALSASKGHTLSKREVELLRVLSTGVSNDAISDQMCISPHTVKTHLHSIFHKIGVKNRVQAVLWMKENL